MLDQIERDSDHIDFTGRRAIFPTHSNRNRGRGSIADGGTLPTPQRNDYVDAIVNIRYHFYGMAITEMTVKQATAGEGAFVNVLDNETKLLAQDMKKDINRQVFGDGTGLLGTAASAAAAVITLNANSDIQYLFVGDPVDLLLKSTGAVTAGVAGTTITVRTPATPSVTLAAAPGTPASINNTYGLYVAGSYGNEMDGLRNIVNTSRTLHSINSATAGNEFWNAQVTSAGSAVAGESLFEQVADNVGATGQAEVETFLTTRGIRRRLADTYQTQKRFNDAKAVEVHGGYSAIMVNEIPVIADDDCPKGNVFALNRTAFKWMQIGGPDWLKSKDGSVFQLGIGATAGTRTANWQAWFEWFASLACVAPNRNGRLTNCTDDTIA